MSHENEIIFKWTNLCRLCLSSDCPIDLFSPEVLSQDILSKLRSCLNLLVYPGDPMPSKLCTKCHMKLDEWYQFRKECIQSEANVKKRLQPYQDIKFVKEYFQRCAKFESSEIVSSSSKTHSNSIQNSDEVNSSIPTQEYADDASYQPISRKPTIGPLSHKLKTLGLKRLSSSLDSSNFSERNVKPKLITSIKAGDTVRIKQEKIGPENSGNKKHNSGWLDVEPGTRIGTITSVTGSASAFWDSQYHGKQTEEANDFYGNGSQFIREEEEEENDAAEEEQDDKFDYSVEDRTCPNCEIEFATDEEFESHTCCMIGSSNYLDDEDEGHFEDSISLGSEYDANESYGGDDQQFRDNFNSTPIPRIKITPWKCIPCHLYFESCLDLRRHYASINCLGKKNRALDCEFCYRQFMTFNDLLEHQVTHIHIRLDLTEDDLICCNQCWQQFPNEKRLKNHMLVHTLKRVTRYSCPTCNKVYLQKEIFDDHVKSHTQAETEAESPPDPMELAAVTYASDASESASQAPTEAKSEEESKPQKAVRCFRCGQMFANVKQLEQHEAMKHKNPTPYICRKCCLRFSARSQLLMHLRVHMSRSGSKASSQAETAEKTNCCTICHAKFLLLSDLESHMKTHKVSSVESPSSPGTPNPPDEAENRELYARYKCSLCTRLYVRASSCIRHGQQSHKGQIVIPLKLKKSVYLGRRSSVLPGGKGGKAKHKCNKCPKYFFSFSAFSIHSYRNHGIKIKNPNEDSNLVETEEQPSSPKPEEIESKCPFCSKDIKPSYISLHIKKFHRGEVLDPSMIGKDIPNDSCICRYCMKTCSTPHNRKLHESIHYPVKAQKNQCDTCGQKLSERGMYEEHVRTCKSIRCGKCNKIFFKFVNLAQHSCSGTKNDEVHKCTVCLSAFTSLDLLQIHIKNFHGKKQVLNIPQPGTSKNSAKRLERELWREESNKIVCMVGEKFYCTFCDCEFSTIQESNEHRAAHPRGNWYAVQISDSLFQCTICDKFFETRKSSLLHINYHKKNFMPETPRTNFSMSMEPDVEIFTTATSSSASPSDTPKAKKFNCRYCSAGFRDEEALKEHLFHTHVNIK